jgi:hypothetical protein
MQANYSLMDLLPRCAGLPVLGPTGYASHLLVPRRRISAVAPRRSRLFTSGY